MPNFTLDLHQVNNLTLRLAATGEVDLATGDILAQAITAAVSSGRYTELVVDLGGVSFLDSTGIAVLVAGRDLAVEHRIAYAVINAEGMVRNTLDITGGTEHPDPGAPDSTFPPVRCNPNLSYLP